MNYMCSDDQGHAIGKQLVDQKPPCPPWTSPSCQFWGRWTWSGKHLEHVASYGTLLGDSSSWHSEPIGTQHCVELRTCSSDQNPWTFWGQSSELCYLQIKYHWICSCTDWTLALGEPPLLQARQCRYHWLWRGKIDSPTQLSKMNNLMDQGDH